MVLDLLLNTLSFQTLVEETVSREIYEDTYSIVKEMLKEMTFKIDAGLSFKLTPTESTLANTSITGKAGVEFSRKEVLKDVAEFSTIKVIIMTAKHKFQVLTWAINFYFKDTYIPFVPALLFLLTSE